MYVLTYNNNNTDTIITSAGNLTAEILRVHYYIPYFPQYVSIIQILLYF